jgi:hypothetical protein
VTEQQTAPAKAWRESVIAHEKCDSCTHESGVEGSARELLGLAGLSSDAVGGVLHSGSHCVCECESSEGR